MPNITANERYLTKTIGGGYAFINVVGDLDDGVVSVDISKDGGTNWNPLCRDLDGTPLSITGDFNALLGPLPGCEISVNLTGATSPDVQITLDSIRSV